VCQRAVRSGDWKLMMNRTEFSEPTFTRP